MRALLKPDSSRWLRLLIVLAGIFIGQAILYWPSLVGAKVLLPLDILAEPNHYLPRVPGQGQHAMNDFVQTDLVLQVEPGRRYVGSEIRAGRFPLWNPYQFAGVPNTWPKFSPFFLLSALTESPKVLPWIQVLIASVAGTGFYVFCRRVLQIAFWPAAVASWCYPVTAFFILWQGYTLVFPVVWLPWQLLAIHQTIGKGGGLAAIGLAITTCLVLISGQLDVAAQVLLVSGIYGIGAYLVAHHKRWFTRQAICRIGAVALALGLGFMLATPAFLTILEYSKTGSRIAKRTSGMEERPPVGLPALPQIVLPNLRGSSQHGTLPILISGQPNAQESSIATYAGMLATLLFAPLAWCSRRHRSMNLLLAFLALFALSWCLNVPGFVQLLRLPGLNMMSHNRLVFAASFAILALAAIGLDVLWQGRVPRRWWFWLPAALLAGLGGWCLYRAAFLPEPIATEYVNAIVKEGKQLNWVTTLEDMKKVQGWFARYFFAAGLLSVLALGGWLLVWFRKTWPQWTVPALGIFLLGDLLWFACGRNAQCDPALYYPRIPVLEQIAKATTGRIVGYGCLPPALGQILPLRDIRGYDGVDPARLMALMKIAAAPTSRPFEYSLTQWFAPTMGVSQFGDVQFSPILDMLGVQYVLLRGNALTNTPPAFQGDDYWALVNNAALPRTFVPQRVETIVDSHLRLGKMSSPEFNPREVAYVETPVSLPTNCFGTAEITHEIPEHITVSANMQTPGLVVLSDLWDAGWHAYLNGQPVPILRANHAIRGVVVPEGTAILEFRYQPASLKLGLWLAGFAAVVVLVWLVLILIKPAAKSPPTRPASA